MGSSCSFMASDEIGINAPRRNTIHDSSQILTNFCLTSDQTQLITETWQNITNKDEFSVLLFLRIFKLCPYLLDVFGFENFLDDDKLKSSSKFLSHASNFSSFLNLIINHINGNENVAIKVCKVIGREHHNFTKNHQQFETKYWKVFVEALLIEMIIEQKKYSNNQKFIESVRTAWSDLFGKVVEIMEISYNKEKVHHKDS